MLVTSMSSQNIKVLPDLKVDSTKIKITEMGSNGNNSIYYAYTSFDTERKDSLIVTISTMGTSLTTLRIDFTHEPTAYITLWSDYNEFDGKDTKRVEFEVYLLEINTTTLNKGDWVYGRFRGVSKPIKNSIGTYRIEFLGEFSHQIGTIRLKKKEEESYRIITEDP